jgi:hypothetical protein
LAYKSFSKCIMYLEKMGIVHPFFTELFSHLDNVVKKEIITHNTQFP